MTNQKDKRNTINWNASAQRKKPSTHKQKKGESAKDFGDHRPTEKNIIRRDY